MSEGWKGSRIQGLFVTSELFCNDVSFSSLNLTPLSGF